MPRIAIYAVLIALAFFVYETENVSFNAFTVWNLLPLIVSMFLFEYGLTHEPAKHLYGACGFLIGSMAWSGYYHLAWHYDWQAIKTSSSTAGLLFLFIPIYALPLGGVGYVAARIIAYLAGATTSATDAGVVPAERIGGSDSTQAHS